VINRQSITGAPPPARLLHQNPTLHQVVDISKGRILRAFGEFGPFGRGQFAFETIEKPIEDQPLPLVEWILGMRLPEAGLVKDAGQDPFVFVLRFYFYVIRSILLLVFF